MEIDYGYWEKQINMQRWNCGSLGILEVQLAFPGVSNRDEGSNLPSSIVAIELPKKKKNNWVMYSIWRTIWKLEGFKTVFLVVVEIDAFQVNHIVWRIKLLFVGRLSSYCMLYSSLWDKFYLLLVNQSWLLFLDYTFHLLANLFLFRKHFMENWPIFLCLVDYKNMVENIFCCWLGWKIIYIFVISNNYLNKNFHSWDPKLESNVYFYGPFRSLRSKQIPNSEFTWPIEWENDLTWVQKFNGGQWSAYGEKGGMGENFSHGVEIICGDLLSMWHSCEMFPLYWVCFL